MGPTENSSLTPEEAKKLVHNWDVIRKKDTNEGLQLLKSGCGFEMTKENYQALFKGEEKPKDEFYVFLAVKKREGVEDKMQFILCPQHTDGKPPYPSGVCLVKDIQPPNENEKD